MTSRNTRRLASAIIAALFIASADSSHAFQANLGHAISNFDVERCGKPTLAPAVIYQDCVMFIRMFGNDEYYRPQLAQVLFFLATAYIRKAQTEVATKTFGLALDAIELVLRQPHGSSSDNSEILNNRCWTKAVSGIELNSALADCDEALKLTPNSPDTLDARAFVLYRQGKYRDALTAYDVALTCKSDNASALFMRGVTKFQLGDEPGGDSDVKVARTKDADIDALYAGYGITLK